MTTPQSGVKDTGWKKLQRERDEYFAKWGEYMKRANLAEERIKQLEGLLGECEVLINRAVDCYEGGYVPGHDWGYDQCTVLEKLKSAKDGDI